MKKKIYNVPKTDKFHESVVIPGEPEREWEIINMKNGIKKKNIF